MKVTQGCFSFLPDLTDEQVSVQVEYCLKNQWAIGIEYTDDPHPRNTYWEMWGNPMFDLQDAAGVMLEIRDCRKANPNRYIRINYIGLLSASRKQYGHYSLQAPRSFVIHGSRCHQK